MSSETLARWSGMSCMIAGLLLAIATMIHPARETAQFILSEELRLETAHWLFTLFCAFLMLGLPGIYAAHAVRLGRLGLAGFILLFFGTLFFAVSDDYGFIAPVLARMDPPALNAVNKYPSNTAMDVLFVICLLIGFILFAAALPRARALPRWSGALMTAGFVLFMAGGALSQTPMPGMWGIAVAGTALMGSGLAWMGYAQWSGRTLAALLPATGKARS